MVLPHEDCGHRHLPAGSLLRASVNAPGVNPSPPINTVGLSHNFTRGGVQQRVLHAVSIDVLPGQSVALIGRSGSGKSTLLNLISGLEPIQQGEIQLFGHALSALSDRARTLLRRKHIGFIYQSFNLIPTLSIADNVALPLALAGQSSKQQDATVLRILESVGLADRAGDYPDRLSGGEQQRVAIARALVHTPPLILADEPTGNLDAESGRHVLSLLSQLVIERGAAMLLVTHSREVARIADHTLSMRGNEVHAYDPAEIDSASTW